MSAGPFLSTTWFAPDQRATATAVASLFSYLGGAASFVVGPLVVPAPNDTQAVTVSTAAVSVSVIRDKIQLVMYAGTNPSIDSKSFQHHVSASGDTNTIRQRGATEFLTNIRKPPIIIFITTQLKNRLQGLLWLTDSEN